MWTPRSPRALVKPLKPRMGLVALLASGALGVAAQSPPLVSPGLPVLPSSTGSDRAAIAAQRQAIEQAAQQQALACQSRFAVTACLEGVRAQQREALAPWRERELQLDEDSRHDRATARAQALQRKAQNRPVAPAESGDPWVAQPKVAAAPTAATPRPARSTAKQDVATPDAQLQRDEPRPKSAQREQQADRRVQASAQRAAAAARVQERVNKRLAAKPRPPGQPAP
jgi:colicin import membrane protein